MEKRMPAEWENPARVLLALPAPHTDWADNLEAALAQYSEIITTLAARGEQLLVIGQKTDGIAASLPSSMENVTFLESVPYNDTWTRDYGPITVKEKGKIKELDFGFNAWGLKFPADRDNLVNLHLKERRILDPKRYVNRRDFILEGGSVESDGKGTILTTSSCLCSPNRNGGKSKRQIERFLARYLGARRVLWLNHGFLAGDDTDSHIDTLARMAPDDTILYTRPPEDRTDMHYRELKAMEKELEAFRTEDGKPYRLIPLPFPDAEYSPEGERLPATYANYLVTGTNVFLPTYGNPVKDAEAMQALKRAFPTREVWGIRCNTLLLQHGSLHCSTMQLY